MKLSKKTQAALGIACLFCLISCKGSLKSEGTVSLWITKTDNKLNEVASTLPKLVYSEASRKEQWLPQIQKNGKAFDLAFLDWGRELQQAVLDGQFTPLDPYINRMPRIKDLWPGLDRQTAETDLLFLPVSVSVWGLFYNKQILKELNIGLPVDWDSFEKQLKDIKLKGYQPVALGSNFGWPGGMWFAYMDLRINGADKHRDLLEGKRPFDSPDLVSVYTKLQDWRDEKLFDPLSGTKNWPDALIDLAEGRAVFMLANSSAWLRFSDTKNIGFMAVPAGPDQKIPRGEIVNSKGFAVTAGAQNPEAALSLAYSYLVQGAAGQIADSYQILALKPQKNQQDTQIPMIKLEQQNILGKTKIALPQMDRILPAQSAYNVNQVMIQFFSPGSIMSANELASALGSATEAQ